VVGALAAVLPDRPAPGTRWGDYPQRDEDRLRGLRHALLGRVRGLVAGPGRVATILGRAERLAAEERPLPALAAALRARVASAAGGHGTQAEALALACVAARRELGLTPYPSQLRAAAIMLDEGLAELATGEGKTLALALAAAARALTGVPVLINTSFNVKGEPIIETPQDAVSCFLTTGIDHLVLHDTLVSKTAMHKVVTPVMTTFGDVATIVSSTTQDGSRGGS
jgi:hypothetical protein